MMKKFLALFLACLMVLPMLAACTDTKPPVGTTAAPVTTEAPVVTTAAPVVTTAAPVDLPKPEGYNVLSIEEYEDKTMAGFMAQLVGFLSGYEFVKNSDGSPRIAMPDNWFELCNGPYAEYNSRNKHGDKLLKNEKTGLWEVWNDDDFSIDVLNQYILRDMYTQYGTFASKVIKDGWLRYDVWDMGGGHRTYGAYGIMNKKGYYPQFTGSSEYGNQFNVNGEPYIANETLGMNAAGMPDVAVEMAETFGGTTSDRDPTEWLKFFAAMYAMAYFEDDIPTLIRDAQKKIFPEGSWQSQVVDMVFGYKEKYPQNWRLAALNADRYCHQAKYDLESAMGETSINCAMILIGMLYGEGDFYETCKIISLAGHGGDSTTPVGLGIVAIACGWQGIDESSKAIINEKVWQDGEGVLVNRAAADVKQAYWMYAANLPERIKFTEILEMYQQNFESVLLENGGEIRDGKYYIPKSLERLSGVETVYVNEFEGGNLDGFTKTGTVEITDKSYSGKGGVKISGSETGSTLSLSLTGLEKGKTYRVSGFISTTAKTTAELFAKNAAGETVAAAHVYDQNAYVKRALVFTATDKVMTVGVSVPVGTAVHRYAVLDELTVIRAEETRTGTVTVNTAANADGTYTGKVDLAVSANEAGEQYLKLTFANATGRTVDAKVQIDGALQATAPIYKTGTLTGGNNTVYIPVIAKGGAKTYTVSLHIASGAISLYDAELVTVKDRF